jgi:hypothetical protein
LIYLISVAIWLIASYKANKQAIYNIGDLLDETAGFMYCPLLNTVLIIVYCLCTGFMKLWKLSKVNTLWEKFRNIKIR